MTAAYPEKDRNATLARINTLWREAEKMAPAEEFVPEPSKSEIMGRIDALMHDAEKIDFKEPSGAIDEASIEEMPKEEALASVSGTEQDLPSEEDIIDELAARVNTAALASADTAESEDFDSVKSRIEAVSRIRPSHQDNSEFHSPEYAFGDAFSTLIRHEVRQYIDNEFEDVIRHAIKSELTRVNWEVDDTISKTSPQKRKK